MLKNNVEKFENECSGCGACYAVCPKKAIIYELDEEGFYKAKVDEEKCINCGKCIKSCTKNPVNNTSDIKKGTLYAAKTRNTEILKKCTSGGIAYEIGKYGLENGYYLVGTAYNYEKNIAETIIVNDLNGLNKLLGSKYIQSKSNQTYKDLINLLKGNKDNKAIVFGTPCQIYGAKNMILTENLKNEVIYIDLFCHGVPSYLVWKKYLKELRENKNITEISDINFRDKKYGWHNFVLKITHKTTEYKKSERDDFYKIFFDNVFFNKSCLSCKVRKEISCADIRLGDFWGKKYSLDVKGVSAVLILTNKGIEILQKISKNITFLDKNICIEDCLRYQSISNYDDSINREIILKELKKGTKLSKIIKKYRKNFSIKQKIICKLKLIISYLPSNIKIRLASILKK